MLVEGQGEILLKMKKKKKYLQSSSRPFGSRAKKTLPWKGTQVRQEVKSRYQTSGTGTHALNLVKVQRELKTGPSAVRSKIGARSLGRA